MKAWRRAWSRLRGLMSRRRRDDELAAELQSHLEMLAEDHVRADMSPAEARRAAMIKFGGIESTKEQMRERRGWPGVSNTVADVRYAVRALRKAPAFTAVALLVLGLAIGANTAIFGLIDQLLFHPSGVTDPERVVVVRTNYDKLSLTFDIASPRVFAATRVDHAIFERVAASHPLTVNYLGGDQPTRLSGATVSTGWFDVFGARPMLGRAFLPEEDVPGANRVVVLAHRTWTRLFGADAHIVGRTIELNEQAYRVIGVMNRGFGHPGDADLWIPLALTAADIAGPRGSDENLFVVGRTRPEISQLQADRWLALSGKQLIASAPAPAQRSLTGAGFRLGGRPFVDANAGATKTPAMTLFAGVVVLLLIACANIGGLMVARTSARGHELGVRAALGATRGRLLRQVLVESLVLAVAGGLIGWFIAHSGTAWLLGRYPSVAAAGLEPRQNLAVFLFTAGTSIAAALLFGWLPAWRLTRVDLTKVISSGGRTVSKSAGQTLRMGLVVVEAALAVMLMVSAGLCVRSFAALQRVDPGFEPAGVVTAAYALPQGRQVDPQRAAAITQTMLDRLHASPAVSSAAIGGPLPFSNEYEGSAFQIEGQPRPAGQSLPQAERRWVTAEYARTLGIRVDRGRFFNEDDRAASEPVVVVDAKLSREYFPGQDPVGHRIRPTAAGEGWYTIVGVVKHIAQSTLATDADRGVYYNSAFQRPVPAGFIVVKTASGSATGAAAIRDAVRAADRNLPVFDVRTMDERLAESLAPRRAVAELFALFAAAALLLAVLGLYGIVNHLVEHRSREIAIRVALGARRAEVLRLVVGQGVRLAAVGSVLGFAGAMISSKWLESQLFHVRAFDPATVAVTVTSLLAAAAAASYLPARRVLRLDPAVRLRDG